MKARPCGDAAVLIDIDEAESVEAGLTVQDGVLSVHQRLKHAQEQGLEGIVDMVPAARTLLVKLDPSIQPPREFVAKMESLSLDAPAENVGSADADVVTVPTVYDGPDLETVARLWDVSVDEVVSMHSGMTWRAAFGGFAPGFTYLLPTGDFPTVPRLDSPRPRIPRGSVGMAGAFSGVYPQQSPGGWQLLGHTEREMWDTHRTPPALIQPGQLVRFEVKND